MTFLFGNIPEIQTRHIVMLADRMNRFIDGGGQFGVQNEVDFRLGIKLFQFRKEFGETGTEGKQFFRGPVFVFVFSHGDARPAVVGCSADQDDAGFAETAGACQKRGFAGIGFVVTGIADS